MSPTPPAPAEPLYDDAMAAIVRSAADRLLTTLVRETPALGTRVLPWLASLSRSGLLADYFMHPRRFPILLLPWWAAEGTRSRDDRAFHEDLALGTMSGYCYIRLLDDLVDRRGVPGLDLLPAAGVFHLEFQSAYQRHFPAESPLWPLFKERWLGAADATVPTADRSDAALAARAEATMGPALIPVMAACLHAGVPERFERWRPMVLELARMEQFLDDLLDWQDDLERGQPNLVLAEAARRARPGETPVAWVAREGYAWALQAGRDLATQAAARAEPLDNRGLGQFVALRLGLVEELAAETGPGLKVLADLARAFDRSTA